MYLRVRLTSHRPPPPTPSVLAFVIIGVCVTMAQAQTAMVLINANFGLTPPNLTTSTGAVVQWTCQTQEISVITLWSSPSYGICDIGGGAAPWPTTGLRVNCTGDGASLT